jgi:hypothetical protein
MTRKTTGELLEQLRERERKLLARRRSLEARIAHVTKQRELRGRHALGSAVVRWAAENEAVRAVLPAKLRPFVNDADWPIVELALNGTKEEKEP